ncbi:MAG: hypothetical protein R3F59_24465 [Myxococcota bacterium]
MTGRFFAGGCLGLALAVATALVPVEADATSFAPMSIEQFTDASTWIVEGQVEEVWTELDAESGLVWTRARVHVTETHKGPSRPDELIVDSAGGTFGAYEMNIPGRAQFSVGEDIFVFLDEVAGGRLVPVSSFEGKYTIRRAPGETRQHVMTWQGITGDVYDARFLPHPSPEHRLYLDDLRAEVQERLDHGWDGQPIPGLSVDRLRTINTIERRLPR